MRISGTDLEDTFRALIAVAAQPRKDFSRMVKETKKKSGGGDIEQLEIEIESNEMSKLTEIERKLVDEMLEETRENLQNFVLPTSLTSSDRMINTFVKHIIDGSIKLLCKLKEAPVREKTPEREPPKGILKK